MSGKSRIETRTNRNKRMSRYTVSSTIVLIRIAASLSKSSFPLHFNWKMLPTLDKAFISRDYLKRIAESSTSNRHLIAGRLDLD